MQIRFSYETKYGTFSDALNLPDDHGFTEEELITMQEQRRDNWITYIDTIQVEPATEEQIVQETSELIAEETLQETESTTEPSTETTPQ
jgi:hypothetical protein